MATVVLLSVALVSKKPEGCQELTFQTLGFRGRCLIIDVWPVKRDAESFAPKVKEVSVGIQHTTPSGSIVVEGVLANVNWRGGRFHAGRSCLGEPLQIERLVLKPNGDECVGMQTLELDGLIFGIEKPFVA